MKCIYFVILLFAIDYLAKIKEEQRAFPIFAI